MKNLANAEVATVLGSISASSDTMESEGRQMKQSWIQYIEEKNQKNQKNPPFKKIYIESHIFCVFQSSRPLPIRIQQPI